MTDKWAKDSWKTPVHACLACGYVVDAASMSPLEPEPRGPEAGDVTVCLECSHIMVFKSDLTVREPTPAELDEIVGEEEVQKILLAMKRLRESKLWERKHATRKDRAGNLAGRRGRGAKGIG